MTTEFLIRPRVEADLADLAQILVEVHGRDGYPVEGVANPVAWLTPDQAIQAWSAVDAHSGELLGQVVLSGPKAEDGAAHLVEVDLDQVAVLGRLFVSPSYRGLGVGKALTRVAMEYARDSGLTAVLDVMTKDTAAIRTYESLGWQRIGEIAHEHGQGDVEAAIAYRSPE